MKHQITRLGFESDEGIDISSDEFESLTIAKRKLGIVVAFEEKFNLIIENYLEFERELSDITLRRLILSDTSWDGLQDDIYQVNRRIVNLLASTKLYVDQTSHDFSDMYGKSHHVTIDVHKRFSIEYDVSDAYRIMDALRNHIQHRSLPVAELVIESRRIEDDDEIGVKHTISPLIDVTSLEEDSGFKPRALIDVQARQSDEGVSVTPLIRSYVESIGRIHAEIRAVVEQDADAWEIALAEATERGGSAFGGETAGLTVSRFADDGSLDDSEHLAVPLAGRRKFLQRRTSHVRYLANHYVSGEA